MNKILIFSLAYYPQAVSGAEAAIKEITDRIDPSDIEFHMITLRFDPAHPDEEKIGNVIVHRVCPDASYMSKILFIPRAVFAARQLHKQEHFDALWSVLTYMLFPVVLLRLLGTRIPHVLTLQDGDSYEKVFHRWFIRSFTPLLDYGFRTAAVVQAISAYLATWPQKRGYRGEVVIVPNGANPLNLRNEYSRDEAERIKNALGKKEGDVFLLLIARMVDQKAQDDIIRALTFLPEHIKLILGGSGRNEMMLKQLADELGVASRVHFVGLLDRTQVPNYRNPIVADIFVHPSRSEGLGIAVLSAMAARLPIIATQEGGLADVVFDTKRNPNKPTTAWVVDKDSPEQIAEAVQDILAHPEKAKEVTETARRMVEETYDWDTIAVTMRNEVFGKVLDKKTEL